MQKYCFNPPDHTDKQYINISWHCNVAVGRYKDIYHVFIHIFIKHYIAYIFNECLKQILIIYNPAMDVGEVKVVTNKHI